MNERSSPSEHRQDAHPHRPIPRVRRYDPRKDAPAPLDHI
jgi:hypothetical protein